MGRGRRSYSGSKSVRTGDLRLSDPEVPLRHGTRVSRTYPRARDTPVWASRSGRRRPRLRHPRGGGGRPDRGHPTLLHHLTHWRPLRTGLVGTPRRLTTRPRGHRVKGTVRRTGPPFVSRVVDQGRGVEARKSTRAPVVRQPRFHSRPVSLPEYRWSENPGSTGQRIRFPTVGRPRLRWFTLCTGLSLGDRYPSAGAE